jgi:hypothetical protein
MEYGSTQVCWESWHMTESRTFACRAPFIRREHRLKTWPEQFVDVAVGRKRVEIRKNDRGYREGDELVLVEYDPAEDRYTGRVCRRTVTHVLEGVQFGLAPGYAALSLEGYSFTQQAHVDRCATAETPEPKQIEQ